MCFKIVQWKPPFSLFQWNKFLILYSSVSQPFFVTSVTFNIFISQMKPKLWKAAPNLIFLSSPSLTMHALAFISRYPIFSPSSLFTATLQRFFYFLLIVEHLFCTSNRAYCCFSVSPNVTGSIRLPHSTPASPSVPIKHIRKTIVTARAS